MDVRINAPVYQKGTKQISFLDSVVVENAEEKELVVFAGKQK